MVITKKINIILIIFILGLLILDCSSENNDIVTEKGPINFNKVFKLSELNKIDSSKKFYGINQLYSVNDNLILQESRTDIIYLYTKNGKFIDKIGRKGKVPGEYLDIQDIYNYKDTLFMFDYNQRRLIKFNIKGEYISSKRFSFPATDIEVNNNGVKYIQTEVKL